MTVNYSLGNNTTLAATITSINGLGAATASCAGQGAFVDFGATRAQRWLARLQTTFQAAPTAGKTIDLYIGWATATATANSFPGGCSGADSAYTGPDGNPVNGVAQLDYIGSVHCCATAAQQEEVVGTFVPKMRYGVPVVFNNTATGTAGGGVALATAATANALSFTSIDDSSV